MKKKKTEEDEKYLAQQKKWANAFTMRRENDNTNTRPTKTNGRRRPRGGETDPS
jgi:hypothetical protein